MSSLSISRKHLHNFKANDSRKFSAWKIIPNFTILQVQGPRPLCNIGRTRPHKDQVRLMPHMYITPSSYLTARATHCYTNADGPDVFSLCAPLWVSFYDRTKDDYDGTYNQLVGHAGCNRAEPPPSAESAICKSFHKEIAALKKKYKAGEIDLDKIDKDLRHFMTKPATESLLIATPDIRFAINTCSTSGFIL